MSDNRDNRDKLDELITQITNAEKRIEALREESKEQKLNLDKAREDKEQAKKVLEEARKYYEAKEIAHADTDRLYRQINKEGHELNALIERLKRELQRERDKARINADYVAQVEAFKQRCLEAYWRSENRSDGLGALPHQIDGAIHLAVAGQALLGDKRGLGKSLTSLIYSDFKDANRIIFVCPSDTMDNYIREIQLWAPHRQPIKIGGMKKSSRDFLLPVLKTAPQFIAVLNYEAWRRDPQLIQDLIAVQADTLIWDEAHRIKKMSTQACRGIHEIRFGTNLCPNCGSSTGAQAKRHPSNNYPMNQAVCHDCGHEGFITDFCSIKNVLPMTGTAILNRPQELFPQLRVIDPANFVDPNLFTQDFCRQDSNGYWTWQYGAEKKLVEKIGPRYLARDRKAAGVIIPPATPVDHIIPIDEMEENYPAQFKAYRQAREFAQIVLNPDTKSTMSMNQKIVVLLRLRQVLVWPAGVRLVIKDEEDNNRIIFDEHLQVFESIKLDKTMDLMKDIIEGDDRVVLFSQFKDPLHELKRRFDELGINVAVYDGSTPDWRKEEIQLDFDIKTVGSNPKYDAVLCNYKAAGEGLNFNAATQMVILDKEWNPGRQSQSHGRIDRIGQTKETTIHNIKVAKSVDEWLDRLQDMKRELVEGYEETANFYQQMYDALRNNEM